MSLTAPRTPCQGPLGSKPPKKAQISTGHPCQGLPRTFGPKWEPTPCQNKRTSDGLILVLSISFLDGRVLSSHQHLLLEDRLHRNNCLHLASLPCSPVTPLFFAAIRRRQHLIHARFAKQRTHSLDRRVDGFKLRIENMPSADVSTTSVRTSGMA